MDILRKHIDWHRFPAVCLENDLIQLIVTPGNGARIVSLVDKSTGREWLVQPEHSRPARELPYGKQFNPATQGGWDEMFPTILEETYPVPGKYLGIPLPDHGELWTQPWNLVDEHEPQITTWVDGKALPYTLKRKLSFFARDVIEFHYDLFNTGPETLHYLWAAHPQFHAPAGTRIILPVEVDTVVNTLPLDWGPEWGDEGTVNSWPEKTLPDAGHLALNVVRGVQAKTGRKFYIQPEQRISNAGLIDDASDSAIWMTWKPSVIPYCGIWIDEGFLNSVPSVAIEPATGYYDSLTNSWNNGRLAALQPGERTSWNLFVQLSRSNPEN